MLLTVREPIAVQQIGLLPVGQALQTVVQFPARFLLFHNTLRLYGVGVCNGVDAPQLYNRAKALTNQVLSALGKPVLPIESAQLEQIVTTGITTVAALVAWWQNNSFTPEAIKADAEYDRLKMQGK